jgi:hypothetical protein
MKRKLFFVLALVTLFITFSIAPLLQGGAQDEGKLSIAGDTEMIGVNEVSGGGHITWTLTGDKAKELRSYVVQMFDNTSTIPCYFAGIQLQHGQCYFNIQSQGDNDLFIDDTDSEARLYLELVDRWLTRSFNSNNRYRYYIMDRVDTLYEEVDASTDGFLDTAIDSDSPVVIKFIFNSIAPPGTKEFGLAEINSTQALYDIFSIRFVHDFEESGNLFQSSGWARTSSQSFSGLNSYWHGNSSTGNYDDNSTSTTSINLDLRYASYGNFSFKYKGSVADSNDELNVQMYDGVTWHDVLTLSQPDNTPTWKTFDFDFANNTFDDFRGKQATLRFNFTSDASGNDTGFFIDQLKLNAPCEYQGQVELGHTDYIVGVGSFSNPYVRRNMPHTIRLLAGEIVFYSTSFDYGSPPGDMVYYSSFDALENPAIVFIVMFICLWFIVSFPNKFYSDYKLALEPKERFKAEKIAWLHWMGRIMILLLLLFYFFPTMFAGIGLNVFIGGLAMIILSILFLASISLASKFLYDRKIAEIPPAEKVAEEPLAPVPVGEPSSGIVCLSCLGEVSEEDAAKCECGVYYHPSCATKLDGCKACGRPIDLEKALEAEKVPVQCPSCAEIAVISKNANLMKEKCEACGSIMKRYEEGYNYLIISEKPDPVYDILGTFINRRVPALVLSSTPKEKLMKKHNLGVAEVYWITTMGSGEYVVDPKRVDFEIMRAISKFMRDSAGGILVIDGIEYLIAENGFEAVSTFLKKVNDMASVNNVTVFVPVNPSGIEGEKLSAIRREFDKVEELTKVEKKVKKEPAEKPKPKEPEEKDMKLESL